MPIASAMVPYTQLTDFEAWINGKSGLPTSDWSSLIGIITAICGNILISFALNTQRYAHIRLSRQREENKEKRQSTQRRKGKNGYPTKTNGYGTQQEAIAGQREVANLKTHAEDEPDYTLEEPTEEDALMPHITEIDENGSATEMEEQPSSEGKEKSYLKSPIWWLGISLMIVGEAGNFLAYGFAPASIVSPLGVVALIFNCLIAPLMLGEEFRWRDGLGVIIAIAGCVTVVLSASDSNPKLTPGAIWSLISRWEFETYFGITAFLIIALSVASNRCGDRTVLIDLGLVGLYGGYTALSTKGVASLLSNRIWRVITYPITYLLLVVLVFTAVMQIKYINRALQRFNATVVIPTQFVMFTLSVIIGSAVLYRDFEREETADAVKFVGGCALTFLGVWCITSGRRRDEDNDEVSLADIDEEATIDLIDEERAPALDRQSTLERRATSPSRIPPVIVRSVADNNEHMAPEIVLKVAGAPPANISAVHPQAISTLSAPPNPPPMHATTSAPIVPTRKTFAQTSRSKTSKSPTRFDARPATPNRNQSIDSPLMPPLTPQQSRLLPASVGLMPAPLTNTLSSSLSAIVADSLRRGVENLPAQTPSPVRTRSGLRRAISRRGLTSSLFGQDAQAPKPARSKRHSVTSGDMLLDDAAAEEGTSSSTRLDPGSSRFGRMRSLSATIGDLFGGSSSSNSNNRR